MQTQMTPLLRISLFNAAKYRDPQAAVEARLRQPYYDVPILHGDDERFWVPATHREARALIRAGYESSLL